MGRPLLSCPARTGTPPGKPVLQPLEGEATRGVPYDQLTVHRGRIRQLHGPGHNLRKREAHLCAPPGAQHHPPRVDRNGRPEPVPLGLARPTRPQIRAGDGSAQHRLRQHPRHTGSLPPPGDEPLAVPEAVYRPPAPAPSSSAPAARS